MFLQKLETKTYAPAIRFQPKTGKPGNQQNHENSWTCCTFTIAIGDRITVNERGDWLNKTTRNRGTADDQWAPLPGTTRGHSPNIKWQVKNVKWNRKCKVQSGNRMRKATRGHIRVACKSPPLRDGNRAEMKGGGTRMEIFRILGPRKWKGVGLLVGLQPPSRPPFWFQMLL